MNQNALQFDELSEQAAGIADVSLIVRARFVEAADTMIHLDVRGVRPGAPRTLWPDIPSDTMGSADVRRRYRPGAAAITRAEEVLQGWLLSHVRNEEHRVLVSRWSVCLAAPYIAGSFRDFCTRTGRVRRTAERRIQREFQSLADVLLKSATVLREPDWSRVSPMLPNSGSQAERAKTRPAKHQGHWLPDDAKPKFDPANPELAALARRLEEGNERRAARMRA